ncbi:unnamed protein product [Cyprideis torosa]|uniref:Uncharacterized protein n=1 Tax=Cyprideis torosa TaxID=163714 RepID=A0A7R8WB64_9CRUS|nr:unnamed protein product [Cyprideis torosa]CAG0886579.1 unnamed protein product [Cyprideis torosa]
MEFSCLCLNIRIHAGSQALPLNVTNIDPLGKDGILLTFSQGLLETAMDVGGLVVRFGSIVQSQRKGDWILIECLNCDTVTHLIQPEATENKILIPANLPAGSKIRDLESSPLYSPVFHVLVHFQNSQERRSSGSEPVVDASCPALVREEAGRLSSELAAFLYKEDLKREERIRRFVEEEDHKLTLLREQANQQKQRLISLMVEHAGSASELRPHSKVTDPVESLPSGGGDVLTPPRTPESEQGARSGAQGLSAWKGDRGQQRRDEEEVDLDSPVQGKEASIYGTSLPIRIPMVSSQSQQREEEDGRDEPTDMAASIRALAQSVQPSNPFGELPRPRLFSFHR